jgi:hypothetical protein
MHISQIRSLAPFLPLLFASRLALGILFRWRFQYGIRLLLALPIVVAVPFIWLAVEMRHAQMQKETVAELRKLGGVVIYDWEWDVDGYPLLFR